MKHRHHGTWSKKIVFRVEIATEFLTGRQLNCSMPSVGTDWVAAKSRNLRKLTGLQIGKPSHSWLHSATTHLPLSTTTPTQAELYLPPQGGWQLTGTALGLFGQLRGDTHGGSRTSHGCGYHKHSCQVLASGFDISSDWPLSSFFISIIFNIIWREHLWCRFYMWGINIPKSVHS